jgi:hypothetical protein
VIDRVYQLLLDVGYPERGVDWLRQHRPALIALLAIGAWALFIGAGWLVWTILT